MAVLHVIRQRKIKETGAALLDKTDPGVEDKEREVGRIHIGPRAADQRLSFARRRLGRKGDAVDIVAEHATQFVLGGDRGDGDSGL